MCKHVLGTRLNACAIAFTPSGARALPNNRKIAIERETAGTGRIRGDGFAATRFGPLSFEPWIACDAIWLDEVMIRFAVVSK